MSISSGGSPWIQKAHAASIAPSMQCAVRVRSTSRTERQVSPWSSKFCPSRYMKCWILRGESRRRSTANSARVRPRSSRRAKRFLTRRRSAASSGLPGRSVQQLLGEREQARSRAAVPDALHADARALDQQEDLVGEALGMQVARLAAQRDQALALLALVGLD